MRFLLVVMLVATFISCTKSEIDNVPRQAFTDTSHILQKVNLFVAVTKPSLYDSAHNFSKDSLIINYNRLVGAPDYLQNQNISMTVGSNYFNFGIDTTNFKTTGNATFILISRMLPNLNSGFVANTVYENTYRGDYLTAPFFLSMHRGNGIGVGKYFLRQDSIPSDATPLPQVIIVCKIIFTKKYAVSTSYGNKVSVVDGKITGSYEAHFGTIDYNKYVSSFDYSCTFQGLAVPN
jgi:hypothetical protein